jgi:hypothetical protein
MLSTLLGLPAVLQHPFLRRSHMDDRASFEAWYEADAMPAEADWFRRYPDGEYVYEDTRDAWKVWQAAVKQEREALRQIDEWAKAYPLDVFPEPDLKRAHEVLEAAGLSLGAISAHAMRHVLTGVQKIAVAALSQEPPAG